MNENKKTKYVITEKIFFAGACETHIYSICLKLKLLIKSIVQRKKKKKNIEIAKQKKRKNN